MVIKLFFVNILMFIGICKMFLGLIAGLIFFVSGDGSGMHSITVIEGAVLFAAMLYYEQLLKKDKKYQKYMEED